MASIGSGNDFQKWMHDNNFSTEGLKKAAGGFYAESSDLYESEHTTITPSDKESLTWLLNQVKNKENLKTLNPEQLTKLRELITSLDKEVNKGNLQHTLANKLPFSLGKLTEAKSVAKSISSFEKEQFLSLMQNAKNLSPADQKKFTGLLPSVFPALSKKEQTSLVETFSPISNWLIKDERAFKSICTLAFKQGSLYSFIGNTTDQTALKMVADVVNIQIGLPRLSLKALAGGFSSIDIPMKVGSRDMASPEACKMLDAVIAKAVRTRMLARLGNETTPHDHKLYGAVEKAFQLQLAQCKGDSCQFQIPSSSPKTAAVDASNKCFHLEKVSTEWKVELPASLMTVYDALASDPNDLEKDLLKIWTQYSITEEVNILQPRLQELQERFNSLNLPSYDPVLIDLGMGVDKLQYAHFQMDMLLAATPTSQNLTQIQRQIEKLEKRPDVKVLKQQKKEQAPKSLSALEKAYAEKMTILTELGRMATDSLRIRDNLDTLSNTPDMVRFTNMLKKLVENLPRTEQLAINVQSPKTAEFLKAASPQGEELKKFVLDNFGQSGQELSELYGRGQKLPRLWGTETQDVQTYLTELKAFYNGLKDKDAFQRQCPTAFMLMQASTE